MIILLVVIVNKYAHYITIIFKFFADCIAHHQSKLRKTTSSSDLPRLQLLYISSVRTIIYKNYIHSFIVQVAAVG